MTSDTRRQSNKRGPWSVRGHDQAKSYIRSPVLESAEQRRDERQGRAVQGKKQQAATIQAITEEEQEKLAELEMQLPRVAGKIDGWLLIIVLTLLCIGIVMVYSASALQAARYQGDASYYFQRELIWMILGLIAMLVTLRVDYRQWRRC